MKILVFPALAAALASCAASPGDVSDTPPEVTRLSVERSVDAAPGTCWAEDFSPAVIETVTERVLVEPARRDDAGAVVEPARYRSEVTQRIVQDRENFAFETPCPDALTPEFVQSLQRALAARELYAGAVNGRIDAATRAAIRAFQEPRGLDSELLSLASARALGLVAVPRDDS